MFSPWVYQSVRIYHGLPFVEFEFTVGPIPTKYVQIYLYERERERERGREREGELVRERKRLSTIRLTASTIVNVLQCCNYTQRPPW